MDKVQEQGAPLPGNEKENWNHHIDVIEIWREVFILKTFAPKEEIMLSIPDAIICVFVIFVITVWKSAIWFEVARSVECACVSFLNDWLIGP